MAPMARMKKSADHPFFLVQVDVPEIQEPYQCQARDVQVPDQVNAEFRMNHLFVEIPAFLSVRSVPSVVNELLVAAQARPGKRLVSPGVRKSESLGFVRYPGGSLRSPAGLAV